MKKSNCQYHWLSTQSNLGAFCFCYLAMYFGKACSKLQFALVTLVVHDFKRMPFSIIQTPQKEK
ncbi:hypothetical protein DQF64_04750 [Moraxella bovis]|nr:hypothetical protein DQF64_04750 [Moraxella bovis]